ncbi:MAG: anti-sigma factor family protein [Thermoanaerobaculia bacterium]
MNRHVSTEQLSAYLDSELGFVEARQIETHCMACPECGVRLSSMRRVVSGLGGIARMAPPDALRQQLRRQVAAQPQARGPLAALESLRFLLFPVRPALHTAAAMGLALVVGLFGLSHLEGTMVQAQIRSSHEEVTVEPGAQLSTVPTTSEVAGREFFWTDDGWIQKGLEGKTPQAVLDSGSARGKALLTKCSGLEYLLADGSAVVLRYNLETVEIRHTPSRMMGFEAPPPRRLAQLHGRTLVA